MLYEQHIAFNSLFCSPDVVISLTHSATTNFLRIIRVSPLSNIPQLFHFVSPKLHIVIN